MPPAKKQPEKAWAGRAKPALTKLTITRQSFWIVAPSHLQATRLDKNLRLMRVIGLAYLKIVFYKVIHT